MAPEERSVAEVMINGKMEPSLIEGGQLVKTLSIGFLADLEEDWRAHGKKVFPVLREKHPQGLLRRSRGLIEGNQMGCGGN
jgi:hypothetical protein